MGIEVMTPRQHCCALPMISKGMTRKALKTLGQNINDLKNYIKQADHIIVTCSSCGLSLKRDWLYFIDSGLIKPHTVAADIIKQASEKTIHISSFINNIFQGDNFQNDIFQKDKFQKPGLKNNRVQVAYHTPCHLKIQSQAQSSVQMLKAIPGLILDNLNCNCCGMAGTWGMLAQNFDLSNQIGSDLKTQLNRSRAQVGSTDCPSCQMQMESFSDKKVFHPVQILAQHLYP